MTTFIFFIINFVAAYFIYDESSFVKPLLQSVMILILVMIIDLIKRNNKKI
jgi:ABC-type molybdate transport system permease subunit